MNKYDLGDPNTWPTVNGQQQYSQRSGLPNGIGMAIVLNNSPYGLDVSTGSDPFRVDAGIGRLLPIYDTGYLLTFTNVYSVPGTNANDLRRVTLEIYEPDEPIYEHYPIELIRNTNVLNTVSTGSSVTQTQSIVYDQSAINGEAPGAVNSQAAAGASAGKVDVTDANPTGGIRKFVMATGEADINPDGTITAPGFHGTADAATIANKVTKSLTLTSGDTFGFPTDSVSGKTLRAAVRFTGVGAGTFNHNMLGGVTPNYIGITTTQTNSTETVGVDTVTSSTVQVNQGVSGWPWMGFATTT